MPLVFTRLLVRAWLYVPPISGVSLFVFAGICISPEGRAQEGVSWFQWSCHFHFDLLDACAWWVVPFGGAILAPAALLLATQHMQAFVSYEAS